jgi:D-aminopeptidase
MAADGSAVAPGLTLRQGPDGLQMQRETENLTVTASPLAPLDWADGGQIAGRYWSDELQAEMTIEAQDSIAFAGFQGLLGSGPMERMYPVAHDVWIMPTRRSMDAAPPGDWTVQINREAGGAVAGLTVGCWLARNIGYRKLA